MNKKIFRNFIWLMKYNLSTLFVFELFHKGLALLLIWPIIQLFINLSIKRSGYVYLVTENLIKILTNPSSIILMLISIIILGFYMFFEITAVIICIDEARKGNKIKVSKLIVAAFKRSLVILNPKNILLFIFVLLIIPLTNLNLTSGLVGSIKVPEYILDYIYSNTILNIIYTIILLLLYILVSRWIFSIYEITLNTKSFNRAVKESLKFTKGKLIKIILYSISLFTIMYLVGFLINIIGIFLIAVWTKYVTDMNGLKELFI
ncbi:glycerophosphoryl diester phosphodiesterase membrane domain-containing protein, partial [Clostridium perfringens]|uniref:glycerophosphoryl diester phosphodiesterase membrane domain-containing protein n=1 Tax=Clostridium perfringens TaxID=1502 RepID=UPI003DA64764